MLEKPQLDSTQVALLRDFISQAMRVKEHGIKLRFIDDALMDCINKLSAAGFTIDTKKRS